MKIQLDHVQRLNLHALLGAQRGDVATIRALWALQDKLALTPEEEKAIELRREFAAGHEQRHMESGACDSNRRVRLHRTGERTIEGRN